MSTPSLQPAAGEMRLHDALPWPAVEIGAGIAPLVDRVGEQVGHVAQPAAAGRLERARRRIRPRSFRRPGSTKAAVMFSRISGASMRGARARRCARARRSPRAYRAGTARWPIGDAAGAGEGEMLAPPGRIEPLDQRGEFVEMGAVEPFGAAERQVEPMRDQGEMIRRADRVRRASRGWRRNSDRR